MSDVKVPFVDLKQRYHEEKAELLACVERVLESGQFILGADVDELERRVAKFTGAKHCVALNSGTDALMLGLWTAGVGRGDEVITTPITFVATSAAIAHLGAIPVYVDVDEDQNIDVTKIEQKITPRTKAIMPVHWTGRIADMGAILDIAQRHGLKVVEDSAQSMGAYWHGKHGGTFGIAGAISCHPLKNFNAVGDGGLLLTGDDGIAEKVRLYRNHGLARRDYCVEWGINSRLDALHAAVLLMRLDRLLSVIERRRRNVELYRSLVKAPQCRLPQCKQHEINSFVMFISQSDDRDRLQAFLRDRGIESLVYYGTPIHLHPAAAKLGYKRGDFPVAEGQADRVLALPHHQHLTGAQIEYVAQSINQFYGAS
ncbi:MAG: DegT/DnrJ/EryC1/StrS family aminotransferase [Alphaproteobacteria bacterium]|nr:DegT/DnrJ/EryC1/StrS family aminotransferase [Alphaproteobacteria bacterium]